MECKTTLERVKSVEPISHEALETITSITTSPGDTSVLIRHVKEKQYAKLTETWPQDPGRKLLWETFAITQNELKLIEERVI